MKRCGKYNCPCEGLGWYIDVSSIDCDEECDECEYSEEEDNEDD